MSERGHRRNRRSLIIILCLSVASLHVLRADSDWKSIAKGMDYKYVAAKTPSAVGDSRIFILRVDPNLWQLEAVGISQTGESSGHTARDCRNAKNSPPPSTPECSPRTLKLTSAT